MALDTYDNLQTALGSWAVNRGDLPTADLLTLAEARLNRDLRLRAQETEAPMVGVIGSRTIALPATFLEPLSFALICTTGRDELDFVLDTMDYRLTNNRPRYWTIDGSNVAFDCPCDQAYNFSLRHLAKFQLSTQAETNWLLANYPDIYLAAGNIEAALWLQDDPQAVRWQARYGDALDSINSKEARSRSMTTLSVDPALQQRFMRGRGIFDIFR